MLKNAFRELDTDNSGTLSMTEIKSAMMEMKIPQAELELIFKNVDFNHDGEINYSEFLAVTVDRRKALQHANLIFAFHHFDSDNSGFITAENLRECFRREGKHLNDEEIKLMMNEVQHAQDDKISLQEFESYMREIMFSPEPGSGTSVGSPDRRMK
jgi:calcium-dependent protein kinase